MELTVCIITKNEMEMLEKCLKALQSYAFQVLIVDTGSTDGTREMAAKYTDQIYDFDWIEDFAAARNCAISKAKTDMIMMLDSDEFVDKIDIEALDQLLRKYPTAIGRIERKNYLKNGEEDQQTVERVGRIFSKSHYQYQGRIHEQLVNLHVKESDTTEQKYQSYPAPVLVEHRGYDGSLEDRQKKASRNLAILLEELSDTPEDTFLLYHIGKSYFVMEEYQKAVDYFEVALGYDVNPQTEYVIHMVESYGYALLRTGLNEKALQFEGLIDTFGNTANFCFLMGFIYMNNMLFEEAVQSFLKATAYEKAETIGVNGHLAFYNAGVIRECMGDNKEAKKYYLKCGNYDKAKEGLERIR